MIVKIFGPPGTGKTTHLLDMLEEVLAAGVPPERVAFLTFTVAARKEATDRVVKRFSFEAARLPYFKTLHSIAFAQLGIGRHSMFANESMRAFGQLTSLDFTLKGYDVDSADFDVTPTALVGDQMMTFDHLRRHHMTSMDEALHISRLDISRQVAQYFTQAYTTFKREEGLYDFTDLLMQVRRPLDVDVVFVDEAQDLSRLQWAAVDVLCSTAQNVIMAGDDDQAIFTWAGASPDAFITRPADEVRVLGQSYRVPCQVHPLAMDIVSMITRRQEKEWAPRDERGDLQLLMQVDGWQPVQGEKTFVLYRNHYVAPRVEEHLRELGFAYRRHDRPVTRGFQWARAITTWEKLRKRQTVAKEDLAVVQDAIMPGDPFDIERPWFETLTRIDSADVQYLRSVLARHGNRGLLEAPDIELMTMHAAKGREADHVVILTDISRRSMDGLYADGDDEVRVYYVGVTRTKKTLTLVGTENPIFNRHLS